MARSLSTDALPLILATAIRPWIGAVETATLGMGAEVRVTADDAITSLRGRIVMTAFLETALIKARNATAVLANKLNQKAMVPSGAKAEALTALVTLITLLQDAKLNERVTGPELG